MWPAFWMLGEILIPLAGRSAARSTSWKISARSRESPWLTAWSSSTNATSDLTATITLPAGQNCRTTFTFIRRSGAWHGAVLSGCESICDVHCGQWPPAGRGCSIPFFPHPECGRGETGRVRGRDEGFRRRCGGLCAGDKGKSSQRRACPRVQFPLETLIAQH